MSYPGKCPNGSLDDGAHDFRAELGPYIQPVIYCARCGEVRPLEVPRMASERAPLPPPNPDLMGNQA